MLSVCLAIKCITVCSLDIHIILMSCYIMFELALRPKVLVLVFNCWVLIQAWCEMNQLKRLSQTPDNVKIATRYIKSYKIPTNLLGGYQERRSTFESTELASLSTLSVKIVVWTQNPLSSQDEFSQIMSDELSRSDLHSVEWQSTEWWDLSSVLVICRESQL